MVEVVVGEKVSLEELGGARMHCTESGLGDALVSDDKEAIEFAKAYFRYMPQRSGEKPAACKGAEPRAGGKPIGDLVPEEGNPRAHPRRQLAGNQKPFSQRTARGVSAARRKPCWHRRQPADAEGRRAL